MPSARQQVETAEGESEPTIGVELVTWQVRRGWRQGLEERDQRAEVVVAELVVVVGGHTPQLPTRRIHAVANGAHEVRVRVAGTHPAARQVGRDYARGSIVLDHAAAEGRSVALGTHGNPAPAMC